MLYFVKTSCPSRRPTVFQIMCVFLSLGSPDVSITDWERTNRINIIQIQLILLLHYLKHKFYFIPSHCQGWWDSLGYLLWTNGKHTGCHEIMFDAVFVIYATVIQLRYLFYFCLICILNHMYLICNYLCTSLWLQSSVYKLLMTTLINTVK